MLLQCFDCQLKLYKILFHYYSLISIFVSFFLPLILLLLRTIYSHLDYMQSEIVCALHFNEHICLWQMRTRFESLRIGLNSKA